MKYKICIFTKMAVYDNNIGEKNIHYRTTKGSRKILWWFYYSG